MILAWICKHLKGWDKQTRFMQILCSFTVGLRKHAVPVVTAKVAQVFELYPEKDTPVNKLPICQSFDLTA